MNNKYDTVIGIDPDTSKSGVAFLDVKTKMLEVTSLSFSDLLDYLQFLNDKKQVGKLIIVVEAGWLNTKSNFHVKNPVAGQRVAKNVGANHQTGKLIIEMARSYGLKVYEQKPLKKCWKGAGGKITHDELAYFTGIMGRTNQEARDAALIAWNFAGLPIRVRV